MSITSQMLNVGAAAGLALVAGCVGAGVKTGVEVGTTHNHFGTGPTATQTAAQPAKPLPETKQIVLLNDQRDLLRASVRGEGADADENALAADIAKRAQGALSADDAKIVTDGNFDVRITIRPKLTVVDQDGDYIRMNCVTDVEMKSADGKRIFGAKKIEIAAPRRVLGKQAAISKLGSAAAEATAEWCRQELKRIANNEIGATVLSVQLPTVPKDKPRDPAVDAANIKAIGDNLAKLPNLVTYEFVGQDQQGGTCKYRVVYFISAYPNGISNEVSALVKSIEQK